MSSGVSSRVTPGTLVACATKSGSCRCDGNGSSFEKGLHDVSVVIVVRGGECCFGVNGSSSSLGRFLVAAAVAL